MASRECYTCGSPVELSEPDEYGVVKELDENDHAICKQCHDLISSLWSDVIDWPSSEDRDLLVDNAIAIGLRTGRNLP